MYVIWVVLLQLLGEQKCWTTIHKWWCAHLNAVPIPLITFWRRNQEEYLLSWLNTLNALWLQDLNPQHPSLGIQVRQCILIQLRVRGYRHWQCACTCAWGKVIRSVYILCWICVHFLANLAADLIGLRTLLCGEICTCRLSAIFHTQNCDLGGWNHSRET